MTDNLKINWLSYTENKHTDLIQYLLDSVTDIDEDSPTTKSLTFKEVIANAVALMFAGSETQSGALTTLLLNMTFHPETIVTLQKEIDELWDGQEETLTYEVVEEMKYAKALLNESARLYPMSNPWVLNYSMNTI